MLMLAVTERISGCYFSRNEIRVLGKLLSTQALGGRYGHFSAPPHVAEDNQNRGGM